MIKNGKIGLTVIGITVVIGSIILALCLGMMSCSPTKGPEVEEISSPRKAEMKKVAYLSEDKMISENTIPTRKIIKKADLKIEIKDYEESFKKIREIVQQIDGFIVNSSMDLRADGGKEGTIVIKVPPEKFNNVMSRLEKLGRIKNHSISGEDVTEEYIDLTARLKNAERVEKEFWEILERAEKIEDILKVEAELGRIREKIEQLEGKIKYLDYRVNLATITIEIYESIKVLPRAISFFQQIQEAFKKGFEGALIALEGIIVFTCTILPVIIYLIIIGLITYWIQIAIRKIRKKL